MIQVDHFWRKILKIKLPNGSDKYTALPKVIKTLLSIHHSNSDVERSLLDNKKVLTSEQVQLGTETIKGIRRTKELAQGLGGTSNVQVDKAMIEAAKNTSSLCKVIRRTSKTKAGTEAEA